MDETIRIDLAASLAERYDAEFFAECKIDYPLIDEFEQSAGFGINRARLENAARVLACPLKQHPACWQHGRIVYAMVRRIIAGWDDHNLIPAEPLFLDIGTAKGFSALMMQFAVEDSALPRSYFHVVSLDVIDPCERCNRNTVAEINGPLTLAEILIRWQDVAKSINFQKADAAQWLAKYNHRVHFAFVDGKHSYYAVNEELRHLARLQRSGDAIVCDDMQIEGVARAVSEYRHAYTWQTLDARPANETISRSHAPRVYAIAVRR